MASDVFHDHDRIIDHEAGGDGQSHQRKIVQAIAAQIHDSACTDQGYRDGYGGNQGCAAVAQENEDNQDDQDDGKSERSLDVTDRCADGCGAIQDDGGVNALWNRCLDGRYFSADAVNGFDNIGAGLPENNQQDGTFAVQISSSANILHRVDDVSDIREMDSRAAVVADNDRLIVDGVGNLVVGKNIRAGYSI